MRSLLLDLPPELVLQILWHLEPDTFSAILVTCKALRGRALDSSALMKQQLSKLPGFEIYSTEETTAALLRLFNARALLHLKNASSVMMDTEVWAPYFPRDSKNCVFTRCGKCATRCDHLILGTGSDSGNVCIYHISNHGVSLEHMAHPTPCSDGRQPRLVMISFRYGDPGDWPGCTKDLAVLYDYEVNDAPTFHDFRLCVYRFEDGSFEGYLVSQMNVLNLDRPPSALFLSQNGTIVMATASELDGRHTSGCVVYHRKNNDAETWAYSESEFVGMISTEEDMVLGRLRPINEVLLNLAPPWFPMSTFRLSVSPGEKSLAWPLGNDPLPDGIEVFDSVLAGVIVATHHQCGLWHPVRGEQFCINTVLELCFNRELYYQGASCRAGAFLLKAVHYPLDCEPFHEADDHDPLGHIYVAKLEGIDIWNVSSIGIKVAVAPRSQRIAMANWKTVLVWALDPEAFLCPDGIPCGTVPGDDAYLEGCGYVYYHCNGKFDEMIVLEPVQLPERGVVFDLMFRDDHELWAWTDQGLVKWYFGPLCNGVRNTTELDII